MFRAVDRSRFTSFRRDFPVGSEARFGELFMFVSPSQIIGDGVSVAVEPFYVAIPAAAHVLRPGHRAFSTPAVGRFLSIGNTLADGRTCGNVHVSISGIDSVNPSAGAWFRALYDL
jgi:hypothetical protein